LLMTCGRPRSSGMRRLPYRRESLGGKGSTVPRFGS